MNKQEFLKKLQQLLQGLPAADWQRSLDYYAEIIDDRMEDGLSEEEAVAAVGTAEEVAQSILAETPVPVEIKTAKRRLQWWEIVLLILGSPIWVALLVSVLAVIFSVWVSLWSVVISLYAAAVALGASAIGCMFGSFFMIDTGNGSFLAAWGAALVCAGLCVLLWLLSNLAAKGMVALTKLTRKGLRRCLKGKEEAV